MIISLVGFRGSGKSSVGPLLAERLQMEFVDTDQQIEKNTKQSIPDIFAHQGEEYFRKVEAETLQMIYRKENQVVATGGGAVLNPQTQSLIRARGPVIWLQADAETTLKRIQKDQSAGSVRPALTDLDFQQEIITLLKHRKPVYQKVSHIQIDTVDKTPEKIVTLILQTLDDYDQENS